MNDLYGYALLLLFPLLGLLAIPIVRWMIRQDHRKHPVKSH
jgi:hypothetical protein